MSALECNPQLSLATRGEDWASQGQPKGKAEIPVVTREYRRNSRKTTWVPPLGKMRPWVRKIPGVGNGNPLQCSCLENPRDGGAWWAAVYGVAQSRTRRKRLSGSRSSSDRITSEGLRNESWLRNDGSCQQSHFGPLDCKEIQPVHSKGV